MSFLKILVFGDAYRYQFLRDLLEEGVYTNEFIHTENLKQHHCVVTREKVLDSSRQDEYLFFESNRIPAFTQIIFPKEKVTDWENTNNTKIIIFDEIPYTTASELESTKSLIQKYRDSLWEIFLVNPNQNFARTDITTGKQALVSAQKLLKGKGYPATIYEKDNIDTLLWPFPGEADSLRIRHALLQEQNDVQEKMKNLPLAYQLFIIVHGDYLDQSIYRNFTRFSQHIPYNEAYVIYEKECSDYYFKGNGQKVFESLFHEIIEENLKDCFLWKREVFQNNMMTQIGLVFNQILQNPNMKEFVFKGKTEEEYNQFCQMTHVDTKFFCDIDCFFKGKENNVTTAPLYKVVEGVFKSVIQKIGGLIQNGK